MKKLTKTALIIGATVGLWQGIKRLSKHGIVPVMVALPVMMSSAHAMSDKAVQAYAEAMKTSANAKNIGMVAKLISDDADIVINRKGSSSTLDKNAYLQLLQKSWAGASDYRYDIIISDIVISGEQALANVQTHESWTKDGKKTNFHTQSKATLSQINGTAILLRSVTQITAE